VIAGQLQSLSVARFANAGGVTGHPDGDRPRPALGVIGADRRAQDFHSGVRGAQRVQYNTVCAHAGRRIAHLLEKISVASVHGVALGADEGDLVVIIRHMRAVGVHRDRVRTSRCQSECRIPRKDASACATRRGEREGAKERRSEEQPSVQSTVSRDLTDRRPIEEFGAQNHAARPAIWWRSAGPRKSARLRAQSRRRRDSAA